MITAPLHKQFAICDNAVYELLYETNCILYLKEASKEDTKFILGIHNKGATGLTDKPHDQIKCTPI